MKPRHQVSRAAIEHIKTFEGYRARAAHLPDGRWTIGYGHTLTAREGAEVSPDDAHALLLYDLIAVSHAVNELVFTPLTQNQFDALSCFAFSIGIEAFRGSAVLRRVNEGELLRAAYAMEMWRRADFEGERIVIDALVRRRSAEKTLFLMPQAGWSPAPSPLLPPKIDYEVEPYAPREEPVGVRADLEGETLLAERAPPVAPAAPPEPPPTAAEQAAAAVTARLESLLPDRAERAPQVEDSLAPLAVEPEHSEISEAPEAPEAPEAAEEGMQLPEAEVEVVSVASIEDEAPPVTQAERWPSPTLHDGELVIAPPPEPATPSESVGEPAPALPVRKVATVFNDSAFAEKGMFGGKRLIGLGVAGLVIFTGGVFWGLAQAPDNATDGATARAVGWVLGVIGVLCFGVAAYGLLRKLGIAEDDAD
ncbi:MAG: hypothetical protein BGN86_00975 [Caulobacterales bacterium 68-7]|nr:lysozyme [Caulobacterales bacterium]OJU11127.1 MAG: hypothetical protein BGN86_00975 [Caulobacterales bacterium 68-7]